MEVHPRSRGSRSRRCATRGSSDVTSGAALVDRNVFQTAPGLGEGAIRITACRGRGRAMEGDGTRWIGRTRSTSCGPRCGAAGRRRRWWRAACFVLAALVIARMPNEYRARALVMVEPFTPHPDLVVPVVNALNLEQKVKSVREGVYSRSLMATALEELKLYPRSVREHGRGGRRLPRRHRGARGGRQRLLHHGARAQSGDGGEGAPTGSPSCTSRATFKSAPGR